MVLSKSSGLSGSCCILTQPQPISIETTTLAEGPVQCHANRDDDLGRGTSLKVQWHARLRVLISSLKQVCMVVEESPLPWLYI